jgi:allantoinase
VKQALKSKRVVTPEGVRPATIVYEAGRILALEPLSYPAAAADAGDCYILPGLVDTHVHVNEPGRTEWEGFRTASRAAAAGGITCIVDMPLNCIPATTSVEALDTKRAAARSGSIVDCEFWGGAVQGNAADLLPLAAAGVRGFKSFLVHPGIEEFTMVNESDLREAMPLIARTGLPLLVHAEHPDVLRPPLGNDYPSYLASRPHASEVEAIRLLVRLCREYHCRIHIVHLSSAEALPDIEAARAEGLPFTVETCPHYLCLAAEEIPAGATEYKCAPPIRESANRELLWKALAAGVIDLIATDHSPCPPELKLRSSGDFNKAWGGIASLSVALPLLYTEVCRRGFSIVDIARWMSTAPAALSGLSHRKGAIAAGFDADFTLFDPDPEWRIEVHDLHFRHPVSPYLGRTVKGKVRNTIVRGRTVFDSGLFPGRGV